VYYQGEPGAFSEAAILHYFPDEEPQGLPSFEAAFAQLLDDSHAFGLLPIENAYRGPVTEVWDRLVGNDRLTIWAEVVEPVHLALMAHAGETLTSIRCVRSHPQALMQRRGFWQPRGYEAEPSLDTAGSAREVAENHWAGVAAIASPRAAQRYGLDILAAPLEDYPDNRTRFWLISQRQPRLPEGRVQTMKATLAFDVVHQPGSLSRVLNIFSARQIDLTKIESRPRPGFPFEFRFWIDLALRDTEAATLFEALEEVQDKVLFYRFLGYYPALIDEA
jgi:prephenate dehydratase